MNVLALVGTAVGSLAVGAIAAGWLVAVTPTPARSLQSSNVSAYARAEPRLALAPAPVRDVPIQEAPPPPSAAAPQPVQPARPPVAATARAASTAVIPPAPVAAAKPSKPALPFVAAVKHRLAKVASLLPTRDAREPPRRPEPHATAALTPAEINRFRLALHLSPSQEAQWYPVADILRMLGRRQMAALKNGEEPSLGSTGDLMQFYMAAQPLLRSLRDDQKAEVRALARRMGFGSYAGYI